MDIKQDCHTLFDKKTKTLRLQKGTFMETFIKIGSKLM